jgi:hypothetical protein
MKLNNVTDIRPDDFDKEDRNTVGQLAEIINPFMQQVKEITDSRIDYDNRVENFLQIEMTVDSNGVPVLNNKIRTNKTSSNGFTVVAAFNLTNNSVTVTGQPFIVYTQLSGGFVQVSKITNLPANQKFRLNVIAH